jgi:hypothetical protein
LSDRAGTATTSSHVASGSTCSCLHAAPFCVPTFKPDRYLL